MSSLSTHTVGRRCPHRPSRRALWPGPHRRRQGRVVGDVHHDYPFALAGGCDRLLVGTARAPTVIATATASAAVACRPALVIAFPPRVRRREKQRKGPGDGKMAAARGADGIPSTAQVTTCSGVGDTETNGRSSSSRPWSTRSCAASRGGHGHRVHTHSAILAHRLTDLAANVGAGCDPARVSRTPFSSTPFCL